MMTGMEATVGTWFARSTTITASAAVLPAAVLHPALAGSLTRSPCHQQQQQQRQHAVVREGSAQQQATALQAAAAVAAATEQRAILQSQMKTKSQLAAEDLDMKKVGCRRVASSFPTRFSPSPFSLHLAPSPSIARSVVQRAEASAEERPAAYAAVE